MPSSSTLRTENLDVAYGGRPVIAGIDLAIATGRITALVGPNGSGKSSLLKTITRLMRPAAGTVILDGRDIHREPTKIVARRLALLPQAPVMPEGLTVSELVEYGRFPYQPMLGGASEADRAAVERAIALTGLDSLRDTPVAQLSGGQRQRAWIAMVAAQDTDMLFLDEPTTFLDLAYQLDVLNLLKRLNAENDCTVVMVLHDLNQAARYADVMIALHGGRIAAHGAPTDVMTPALLRNVFGVEARFTIDEETGRPWCIPLRPVPKEDQPS